MTKRQEWLQLFEEKAGDVHKIALARFAKKMDKRVKSWKGSLVSRSKKYDVECNITLEEVREIMYENYGTPCRYCDVELDINNLVLDHIVSISKGGSSNKENLQVICSKCNHMKGSLSEKHFKMLLEWLDSVPEELSNDVSIRLSRGII